MSEFWRARERERREFFCVRVEEKIGLMYVWGNQLRISIQSYEGTGTGLFGCIKGAAVLKCVNVGDRESPTAV